MKIKTNANMSDKGPTTMKTGVLALAILGAAAMASGCGKTSYFEVTLDVNPDPGSSCLSMTYTCAVLVTGADQDYFTLSDAACRMPRTAHLGLFQFATEKDSGTVNFEVTLIDGNLKPLAKGTGSAPIKPGGRQTLSIAAVPDDAALTAAGCK